MMWIGLVVGVVAGGLAWGMPGAITLGFIGWLTGTIVGASRKAKSPTSVLPETGVGPGSDPDLSGRAASPDYQLWTVEDRLARLEKALGRVEERLARMGVGEASAFTEPQSAPEATVAETRPQAASESVAAPESHPARVPAQAPAPEPVSFSLPPLPPEPPPPAPPPSPPHPIVAWFLGVNAIARVGLVILFFGLAFLLKYAAENQMLPPELRVAAVAAGGIALLFFGWRLRTRREAYALGLQGAGVAVLYLTVFGALRLWHLIPPELAFFLLAGIAVFSAALAILQNSVALAVIGASGGFLAPVLASTGSGNHVMLFGYYLILNLGIAVIAWYRAWRPLNLTGFLFTFLIGLAWGMRSYHPELFDTTETFLIAFFLVFVAISVMVAREKTGARAVPDQGLARAGAGPGPGFGRYVDGTLVFGVPLAGFGLQAALMRGTEYGLSISSLVLAAFYLTLAWGLLKTRKESWNLLAQAFLALGVVFVTLAIPLALDARWTSASWALEGAAIIWIGMRQQRFVARIFGYLLQAGAAVAYFKGYGRLPDGYPLVDAAFVGALLMAAAGYWIHWQLNKSENVSDDERLFALPAFAWALAWTLFAGMDEIHAHVPDAYRISAAIMFVTGTATLFGILSKRWDWKPAAWTARALLPVLWIAAFLSLATQRHPLGNLGWLAWPLAFAALAWILRTIEEEKRDAYTNIAHTGWFLLAALLGAKELHWVAATYMARATAWSVAAPVIIPAILVTIASARAMDNRWPIKEHARAYRLDAAVVIAILLAIWSVYANATHDGSSEPLPYIPLLNALDLAHLLAAFSIAAAWLSLQRSGIEPPAALRGPVPLAVIGALAFIWVNGILLRTLSHYADVPYAFEPMARSVLVQAALSIFWALLALGTMVYATRKALRPLWMAGVALLGVVVAKLFIFDLSNAGRIEQIVSFIAVGVLILVVGYFSPLPPKKPETA